MNKQEIIFDEVDFSTQYKLILDCIREEKPLIFSTEKKAKEFIKNYKDFISEK